MVRRHRLQGRILLVVSAGALLIAVGLALLLHNTVELGDSARASTRIDAYFQRVVGVERLVVDAETGLRGYVITGRTLFLAPLRVAQSQLPPAEAALSQEAAATGAFQARAAGLNAAAQAYLSRYVRGLLATSRQDLTKARTFAVTLAGKREVDAIRGQAAVLERQVAAQQAAREAAARSSAAHAEVEGIIALVLLTLLTIAVGGYLGRLAVARERERVAAQQIADTLQRSILPSDLPAISDCELAVRFLPVGGGIVGGDFYDVFELSPGCFAVVVGDVAGKGPAAATISAMARWTLRSVTGATIEPGDVVRFLNEAMLRQGSDHRFLTLTYLLVSLEGDHARVTIACAGHPAPLFVPRDGEASAVQARGDLLGAWKEIRLGVSELDLHPGDSLVAFTDGVSDPGPLPHRSPEQALRERAPGADADQLAGLLEELARDPSGQRDDVAILAVRFVGPRQSDGSRSEREPARTSSCPS